MSRSPVRSRRAAPGAGVNLSLLFMLAVAPFVFLLLNSGLAHRRELQDDARDRVVQLARAGMDQQGLLLSRAQAVMSLLGRMPDVSGMGPACHPLLSRYAGDDRPLKALFVAAPDGHIACNSAEEQSRMVIGDRVYFQRVMGPDRPPVVISGPLNSRRTGKPMLVVAMPVPGDTADGPPAGMIAADVDLAWLGELAQRAGVAGSVAALIDAASGEVLARSAGAFLGRCAAPAAGGLPRVALQTCDDGVARIYGMAPLALAGHDAVIAVGVPSAAVVADADRMMLLSVAVAVLATLAAFVFFRLLAERTLLLPLRRLTEAARRLGRHDLAARVAVPDASPAELRALGTTFNELAAELHAHQADLAAAREEQARSERLHRILTENATDVIVRLDAARARVYVSPSSREVLGYSPEELLGGDAFALVHPDDLPAVLEVFDALGPANPISGATWRMRHRDGGYIWIEARYRYMPEDGGMIVVLRDVQRRKRAEEQLEEARRRLERLAMSDVLTGLPNRRFFLDAVARRFEAPGEAIGFAVLFIDLDRFKPVNDLHGHAVGDMILAEVARRLQGAVEESALVARLGGDEFAVLLPLADGRAGVAYAGQRIVDALAAPIVVDSVLVEIGASVGISLSPQDGADTAAMLRTADIAMYQAKRGGRGRFCFFERPMEGELKEHAELQREIRHAIAGGEIVPYYQPCIRLADGAIVGMEALARWEHPVLGTLLPLQFVPIAEERGLCRELFGAILSRACADARAWPDDLTLAVNLSPAQLQDPALPAELRSRLADAGFDPRRLELEITETVLAGDSAGARQVLAELRDLGIRVALDDFGTGHASLQHLRELRVDWLKIGPCFAAALLSDPASARFVAAIVGLGQALGIEVVAEGIEDHETMLRLRELGCRYGQGYLFAHPAPADAAWLSAVRPGVSGTGRGLDVSAAA
ncbi:MAG: EAL domain-containing protein [Acidisphaera sp.]|nr:EAL domain-containing protein [Acidisphaera sp.]